MKPGKYPNMPAAEYHALDAIGSSSLKPALISGSKYHWYTNSHKEPTPAMILGTQVHACVLEQDWFMEHYVLEVQKPAGLDGRTAEGKAWFKNHRACVAQLEAEGKEVISDENFAICFNILNNLSVDMATSKLLDSEHEVTYIWRDEYTGLLCKCRPDILHEAGIVTDLKTCQSAREEDFQKVIVNMKYHVQAAHYLNGVAAIEGCDVDELSFSFLAVEKQDDFDFQIIELGDSLRTYGFNAAQKALQTIKNCRESGVYAGYDKTPKVIEAPYWYKGE